MGETEREKAQPRMNYEKILLDMQVKETYSLGTFRDSDWERKSVMEGRRDSTWGQTEGHCVEYLY